MADNRDVLKRIWRTVEAIPPGSVATYGEVARRAGLPRRARWVGAALRAAPDELNLPWHRVINAQGRISLPAGSPAHALQRQRLEAEGVVFDARGRVDLTCFGRPEMSLDEWLWKP